RRSDPEVVTVGIGMRATRSSDKVTRWYFVADGRLGVDFSLIGPDDRPFTRKQLADQIGTDAIVDRPVDYRAAIDARMFGLGVQRYDQLINLILTLRRPQLAKNLDPRGLSQALTDGLRPLDDQLILDAARSFSDMEEVGRTLEGLHRFRPRSGRSAATRVPRRSRTAPGDRRDPRRARGTHAAGGSRRCGRVGSGRGDRGRDAAVAVHRRGSRRRTGRRRPRRRVGGGVRRRQRA
ncbi:hypothetical protein AB0C20_36430, partial [Micromonospora sp. NPDC048843]